MLGSLGLRSGVRIEGRLDLAVNALHVHRRLDLAHVLLQGNVGLCCHLCDSFSHAQPADPSFRQQLFRRLHVVVTQRPAGIMDDESVEANFCTMKRCGLHTNVCDEAAAVHVCYVLVLQHRCQAGVIGLHVVEERGIGIDVGPHALVDLEVTVLDNQIRMGLSTFRALHGMSRVEDLRVFGPVGIFQEGDESERLETVAFLLYGKLASVRTLHEGAVHIRMPVVGDDDYIKLVPEAVDNRDDVSGLVGIRQRARDEVILDVDDDQGALRPNLLRARLVTPQEGSQLVGGDRSVLVHIQDLEHDGHVILRKLLTGERILHQC
mmetsp:Transcript_19062/g.44407  ORF Transcript_19062/g.44407 Transcript_19062/m.44407 type:complete len:321 (+) Transcript_19062:93-1055(+)